MFSALDTVSCLQRFKKTRPDPLILNFITTTMDEGLEFAGEIKKREAIYGVPILIISAKPPVEGGYDRSVKRDLEWFH